MTHDTSAFTASRRSFLAQAGGALAGMATVATLASSQSTPTFSEHRVPRDGYYLYAREYRGSGPTLVLMHGFPDNLHIYDRLIPVLTGAGRHVVTFDFLGFGASDKPVDYDYSFGQQLGDLETVVEFFKLDRVAPVAHDASGVTAIDYVVANPRRAGHLCLINTFYGDTPTLRFPEIIELFAAPELKALAQKMIVDPKQMAFVLNFQIQQFQALAQPSQKGNAYDLVQSIIEKNLFQQPSAGRALAELAAKLRPQMKLNDEHLPQLANIRIPSTIIWGQGDAYLNTGVANDFAARLKGSSLHILDAGHWPQLDIPDDVGRHMLADIKG
jgi:haloalkane dehalogenase